MLLYEKLFKRNLTMQEGAVRHGETEAEGGFKGLLLHVGIFTQYRHMGRTQQKPSFTQQQTEQKQNNLSGCTFFMR